jgi:FkbM family methyltransferase
MPKMKKRIKKNVKRKRKRFLKLLSIIILFFINTYFPIKKYLSKLLKQRQQANKLRKKIEHFTSYSEYYEDLILNIILSNVENGFYIDVGAYDPIKVSVTKAFYLKGWTGINIEPLPGKKELFDKDRLKDINLQLAVGERNGTIKFYINDQCSTYVEQYSKKATKIINITMDTMSNICRKYVPQGRAVDFCKIDVEGGERNVLLGYDFTNYRPKVFCIESTIPLSSIPNHELWENILIQNNYTYVYKRGVNRFYVDNNFPELLERSKHITEYIPKIRKYRIHSFRKL